MTIPQAETVEAGAMYVLQREFAFGQGYDYLVVRAVDGGNVTYPNGATVSIERIRECKWRIFGPLQLEEAKPQETRCTCYVENGEPVRDAFCAYHG